MASRQQLLEMASARERLDVLLPVPRQLTAESHSR